MRLACRIFGHDWNLALCRVGEHQTCRRCGDTAQATERGWLIDGTLYEGTAPRRVRAGNA